MADKKGKNKSKKVAISEEDMATVLERYTPQAIVTLLQEVAQVDDVKIDWSELAKSTKTGITSARELQMLWRNLAYQDSLEDDVHEDAEPLDDDSDLETELEAFPPLSAEASAEAAACAKVLLGSGLPSDTDSLSRSTVEAPLTINIPIRGSAEGKNIIVPVCVPRLPLPAVTSIEGLEGSGPAAGGLPARRKRKPWTEEEDMELIAAVQKCGERNWANILKGDFKGDRTASQLSQRWAIIRKRQANLNLGAVGNPANPQLTEAQLATRRAVSHALNMPMMDNLLAARSGGATQSNIPSNSATAPSAHEDTSAGSQTQQPLHHKGTSNTTTVFRKEHQTSAQSSVPSSSAAVASLSAAVPSSSAAVPSSSAAVASRSAAVASSSAAVASRSAAVASSSAAVASSSAAVASSSTAVASSSAAVPSSSAAVPSSSAAVPSSSAAVPSGAEETSLGSQSQQPPQNKGIPNSTSKSRVTTVTATKGPTVPFKNFSGSNPTIEATAVAAGARIATPSTAASLLKAAQSKNAVHIRPGGGSVIKTPMTSVAKSSSNHLRSHPNVHYIRTGLTPGSAQPTYTGPSPSIPRSGSIHLEHSSSTRPQMMTGSLPLNTTSSALSTQPMTSTSSVFATLGGPDKTKTTNATSTVDAERLSKHEVSSEEKKVDGSMNVSNVSNHAQLNLSKSESLTENQTTVAGNLKQPLNVNAGEDKPSIDPGKASESSNVVKEVASSTTPMDED